MIPERWLKLDRLLAAALDLPAELRAAFAEEATEDDPELRDQLLSLLVAADRSASLWEAPPAVAIDDLFSNRIALETGQRLAHYEIDRVLGVGGMGQVYLARDSRLGRQVALKLLPPTFTTLSEQLQRFEFEARAASSLNHPNILTIHAIGQSDNVHFIAAEYVEGKTLRQKMAEGQIPLPDVIRIAMQVAAALGASHAAGIIHRDIKPENIMVRPDGLVKVLDFGLAKLTGESLWPHTQEVFSAAAGGQSLGALMGTPPYMSPEQVRGGELDGRTDLFSLGAVLYEMVAGRPPFSAADRVTILDAICEQDPPPISRRDLPLTFEDLVFHCLAKEPVDRYGSADELMNGLELVADELEQTGRSELDKPSIAILPFANLSGDLENEYFCDGLADELLNGLAKIERLHVVARTSSFSFKGKSMDVREIGKRLRVKTVLEGSVRRAGNRLRITTHLVNASDGYHLWSERFDRQIEDLFSIQDEIVLALIEALKVELLGAERARLLKRYTDNTEAYHLYLKGRAYCHRASKEALDKAIEFFEHAVALEPELAPAWGGIVYAYVTLAYLGYSWAGLVEKCALAMTRAMALDPDQHDVCIALGSFKLYYQWDFVGAEREFKRAIQLAPNLPGVYLAYSSSLITTSRPDEAIIQARIAEDLDPLSIYSVMVLGWAYWYADHYDRALSQTRKLLEMEPDFFGGYWLRGMTKHRLERHEEAIADLEQSLVLGAGLQSLSSLGVCYAKAGRTTEARKVIADLLDRRSREPVQAYFVALVYGGLEMIDEALEWLERAVEERNEVILTIRSARTFDFLSSHPRFIALIARIGFPV